MKIRIQRGKKAQSITNRMIRQKQQHIKQEKHGAETANTMTWYLQETKTLAKQYFININ